MRDSIQIEHSKGEDVVEGADSFGSKLSSLGEEDGKGEEEEEEGDEEEEREGDLKGGGGGGGGEEDAVKSSEGELELEELEMGRVEGEEN